MRTAFFFIIKVGYIHSYSDNKGLKLIRELKIS